MNLRFLTVSAALLLLPCAYAADAPGDGMSDQQMRAQIGYFQQAVDELGPVSPLEAARLWAKGDETRNGAYKYAAACPALKRHLVSQWGDPQSRFWNIGVSSPWVQSTDVVSEKALAPGREEIILQRVWATSAGPEAPERERLVVAKCGENWCVESAAPAGAG